MKVPLCHAQRSLSQIGTLRGRRELRWRPLSRRARWQVVAVACWVEGQLRHVSSDLLVCMGLLF